MQSHLSLVRKQVRGVGCRSSTSSSSLEGCPRSYRSREHQERQASRPTIYNDRRGQALLVSVANREQASGPLPVRFSLKPTPPITSFRSRPQAKLALCLLLLVPRMQPVALRALPAPSKRPCILRAGFLASTLGHMYLQFVWQHKRCIGASLNCSIYY